MVGKADERSDGFEDLFADALGRTDVVLGDEEPDVRDVQGSGRVQIKTLVSGYGRVLQR